MKYVLSPRHAHVLEALAADRATLLAFDFDGTLAPLTDRRQDAHMRPTTARLLAQVSARFPMAVISGRARPDVKARLDGSGVRVIYGGHGLPLRGSVRRSLEPLRVALRRLVAAHATELDLEDKGSSLAVHFVSQGVYRRRAPTVEAQLPASKVKARVVHGRRVVEFISPAVGDKGVALEAAMRRTRTTRALYVGDDRTDEDAFSLGSRHRVIGVRVGQKATSVAPYFIRRQAEVDGLLRALLRLRVSP